MSEAQVWQERKEKKKMRENVRVTRWMFHHSKVAFSLRACKGAGERSPAGKQR